MNLLSTINWKEILLPGAVIGILGSFFALVLALVARQFAVPHNEKIDEIADVLPGLNCGGCSFPNCLMYAENVYKHSNISLTSCKPGGDAAAHELAHLLGRKAEKEEKIVAKVLCRGGNMRAVNEFTYSGMQLCRAAHLVKGGPKACKQGCLEFGDCFSACRFNSIEMGESGLPIIDRSNCIACGACVKACPRGLIKLLPEKSRIFVECMNTDKGAVTTKICEVGCIGCRLCEKECPFDAIHVINNVAIIDHKKCTNCGKCVSVCPRNIILQLPQLIKKQEK
ncbi:MAG: RnfABCDGE type electron transport complex subunit B [Candidatus Omnitrophica bacterium]|nr:RnfABCDGE type electron transport complex subunit B [Candidatus Omnitrophota bacterium]